MLIEENKYREDIKSIIEKTNDAITRLEEDLISIRSISSCLKASEFAVDRNVDAIIDSVSKFQMDFKLWSVKLLEETAIKVLVDVDM